MKRAWSGRRRLVAPLVLLAALAALRLPGAAGAEATIVRERNCTVVEANPKVPRQNINYLVPEHFRDRIQTDPVTGEVSLRIDAVKCEISIGDGRFHTEIHAAFRVPLSEDRPDDPTSSPVHFDDYQLWIASDDPELVKLFRREGDATHSQATLVKDLVFSLTPDPSTPGTFEFVFDAPDPTPSPFRMEVTVREPPVAPVDTSAHHYGGPPGWMVTETISFKIVQLGPTEQDGVLVVNPDSQLGQVLCDSDGDGRVQFKDGLFVKTHPIDGGSYRNRVPDPLPPQEELPQARCPTSQSQA